MKGKRYLGPEATTVAEVYEADIAQLRAQLAAAEATILELREDLENQGNDLTAAERAVVEAAIRRVTTRSYEVIYNLEEKVRALLAARAAAKETTDAHS